MAGPPVEHVIRVAEFRSALLHLLRRTEGVAAVHGLTPQRYLLLLMIKGAPDGSQRATVSELSVRLQLAQQTVKQLVARAERSGLLRRQTTGADRRLVTVRLTPKGDRLLMASLGDLAEDRRALRAMIAGIGSFGDSAAN